MAEVAVDSGSEAWLLTSAALVFFMVPALALFYGGMVSRGAVLSTMLLSVSSLAVCGIVWSLIGYSIAFGPPGPLSPVFGGSGFGAFDSPDSLRVGTSVSEHAFFIFQLAFNTITVAVISGSVVQRISLWAFVTFSALWTLLCYCPLAHWIFNTTGFLAQWGVLDFAGGLVVETASGVSAFVLAYWVGGPGAVVASTAAGASASDGNDASEAIRTPLVGSGEFLVGSGAGCEGATATAMSSLSSSVNGSSSAAAASAAAPAPLSAHTSSPPHNIPFVLLGAGLLWIGWFGFNAGSALASGYLAGRAFTNTHLAASAALATFSLCQTLWDGPTLGKGKPTAMGAANGAVIGLAAITPACGFISQMASLGLGVAAAIASYWAMRALKRWSSVDDRLECLPVHGLAGMIGIVATGFMASKNEGAPTNGAFYGGGGILLGKQCAALALTIAMCVSMTTLCYWVVRAVAAALGLSVRVSVPEGQVDRDTIGEEAYFHGGEEAATTLNHP